MIEESRTRVQPTEVQLLLLNHRLPQPPDLEVRHHSHYAEHGQALQLCQPDRQNGLEALPGSSELLQTVPARLGEAAQGYDISVDPLVWTPECQTAFSPLVKTALKKATSLAFPFNTASIRIFTDASNVSVGALLKQMTDDCW